MTNFSVGRRTLSKTVMNLPQDDGIFPAVTAEACRRLVRA